ncbi:hypothetical protein PHYPSEUDO_002316 [Phytophthora pseudosyringae]|uniref:Uncharacterized protein n=1 Tax=Phytophthora pseudosyringae TaxID=221518 RepID=A0A8T1WDB4_9STRA|nr:hypothetical protein PHYPSEUDO_002316 [Phytophthora pseudosyringae]
MTLGRLEFRCLLIAAFVQFCAVRCDAAASSTDPTPSVCDYASENLYAVNASDPQAMLPTDYVPCANATGADAGHCDVCSCREKKVASVAGVAVTWVVCVGSGDATTCVGSGQEYCDSSSSCGGLSNASSKVGITNGSDASAGASSPSSGTDTSSSTDTGVEVGGSSSFDSISSSVGSHSEPSPAATPSATAVVSLTLSPDGSESQATNEDSVITNPDVGTTAKPTQTDAATSPEQNIIRPPDNGSTHQLDSNNGSSIDSNWSGTRLMAVLTVMCGIAVAAAVAVFVAVRKDQARKKNALGTPSDEFTDDDSSLATPMTHRLDGRLHRESHDRRHGGNGSRDSTPLASIVVIGPDNDFQTPSAYTSAHQYRSYSRKLSDGYARTESAKASRSRVRMDDGLVNAAAAVPAARQQLNVSHGPSTSELPSPTHDTIFDTSSTRLSFSSSMSSEFSSAPTPSERMYESEDRLTDSFRMVSSTYSDGSLRDSDVSTEPRKRETSLEMQEEEEGAIVSNTIISFDSSLSSLDSTKYDVRDTEASEHVHPSELGTNSSRVAMSFDVGSVSPGA